MKKIHKSPSGGLSAKGRAHLNRTTGSINFISRKQKLYRYIFNNFSSSYRPSRILNLDWWTNNANINNFEFIYKHNKTTQTQTILESSGSGGSAATGSIQILSSNTQSFNEKTIIRTNYKK